MTRRRHAWWDLTDTMIEERRREFEHRTWLAEPKRPPLKPEHRAQGGACQERGDCPWCEP